MPAICRCGLACGTPLVTRLAESGTSLVLGGAGNSFSFQHEGATIRIFSGVAPFFRPPARFGLLFTDPKARLVAAQLSMLWRLRYSV